MDYFGGMGQEEKSIVFSLTKRIKENDEKAFQDLFNLFWEPMFKIAMGILQDEDIAKDTLQEVWVDFWQRRMKISNSNIKAYLKQAIRYKAFNELRNRPLNDVQAAFIENLENNYQTDDLLILEETQNNISAAMENLPKRSREIFLMSREENLSNTEIANQLHISKRTVETHISIALKSFRMKLSSFLW